MDEIDLNRLCRRLAEDIKAARQRIGLSQEALALEAGIDRTYVSQLERSIANPSLAILARLAHALDVELQISFTARPEACGSTSRKTSAS